MTTYVQDSFNRADGAVGTADIGGAWTTTGDADVVSNQCVLGDPGTSGTMVIDCATPDVDLTVTWVDKGFISYGRIVLRFQDTSNYIAIYHNQIYRVISGSAGIVATYSTIAAGSVIRVKTDRGRMQVWDDGSPIADVGIHNYITETEHGLYHTTNYTSTWDDITIDSVPAPTDDIVPRTAGARAESTGTTLVMTAPPSVAVGDYALATVVTRDNTQTVTLSGWSSVASQDNGSGLKTWVFGKVWSGSESLTASIGSGAAGWSGFIAAFSGVSNASPIDATAVASTSAAAQDWAPTGVTTNTPQAMVVSIVGVDDDDDLALNDANGFYILAGGTAYTSTAGNDSSVGLAYKSVPSAGSVTSPTWRQVANGPDLWTGITLALRSGSIVVADRFYFSLDRPADAPPLPAWSAHAEWDANASNWVRRQLTPTIRSGENETYTFGVSETDAGTFDILCGQYISEPLVAQTISGSVTGIWSAREAAVGGADEDFGTQIIIRAIARDGTVRGTLLAPRSYVATNSTPGDPAYEFSRSGTHETRFLDGTLSSLAVEEGDRLVIEIGARATNATTSSRTADPRVVTRDIYSDFAHTEGTGGTASNTWIEFSSLITFLPEVYDFATEISAISQGASSDAVLYHTELSAISYDGVSDAALHHTEISAISQGATAGAALYHLEVMVLRSPTQSLTGYTGFYAGGLGSGGTVFGTNIDPSPIITPSTQYAREQLITVDQDAWTYLAINLRTNEILAELPLQSVNFSTRLNGVGAANASFYYDNTYASRFLRDSTKPGQCGFYVLRYGQPVWGGPIWKRVYNAKERKVTFDAETYESYFYKRFQQFTYFFSNDDQLDIARWIIQNILDDEGANIGIEIDDELSGVLRERTFNDFEFKTAGEELEQMADNENGFDWNIHHFIDPAGALGRRLEFGYPNLGVARNSTGFLFEYPGNIMSFSISEDAQNSATTVYAIGSGDGVDQIEEQATNTDAINNGLLLLEQSRSYKSVVNPTTLLGHANEDLKRLGTPITVYEATVRGASDPAIGSYIPGDWARFKIDTNWLTQDFYKRITEINITPGRGGVNDVVGLTFADVEDTT